MDYLAEFLPKIRPLHTGENPRFMYQLDYLQLDAPINCPIPVQFKVQVAAHPHDYYQNVLVMPMFPPVA